MLLNHRVVQTSVAVKAGGILLSFLAALILLMGLAIVFQLMKNTSLCSRVQKADTVGSAVKQAELLFFS